MGEVTNDELIVWMQRDIQQIKHQLSELKLISAGPKEHKRLKELVNSKQRELRRWIDTYDNVLLLIRDKSPHLMSEVERIIFGNDPRPKALNDFREKLDRMSPNNKQKKFLFHPPQPRLMTVDEARAQAASLRLSQPVIDFIVKEFTEANELDHKDGERYVGREGRIKVGHQGMTAVEIDIEKALGVYESSSYNQDTSDLIEQIFDTFFDE